MWPRKITNVLPARLRHGPAIVSVPSTYEYELYVLSFLGSQPIYIIILGRRKIMAMYAFPTLYSLSATYPSPCSHLDINAVRERTELVIWLIVVELFTKHKPLLDNRTTSKYLPERVYPAK